MARTRAQEVKRSQKKSFYLRELSHFFSYISQDEPLLAQLYITRVELSDDGGICYVYFSSYKERREEKRQAYAEAIELLKLYKPSVRKSLASSMRSRYVPDLRFEFDEGKEKEIEVNKLLLKISKELAHLDDDSSSDSE